MIFYNFSTAQVHQILDDLTYRLPEDYVEKNFALLFDQNFSWLYTLSSCTFSIGSNG